LKRWSFATSMQFRPYVAMFAQHACNLYCIVYFFSFCLSCSRVTWFKKKILVDLVTNLIVLIGFLRSNVTRCMNWMNWMNWMDWFFLHCNNCSISHIMVLVFSSWFETTEVSVVDISVFRTDKGLTSDTYTEYVICFFFQFCCRIFWIEHLTIFNFLLKLKYYIMKWKT
jgi:hypothetical protein